MISPVAMRETVLREFATNSRNPRVKQDDRPDRRSRDFDVKQKYNPSRPMAQTPPATREKFEVKCTP